MRRVINIILILFFCLVVCHTNTVEGKRLFVLDETTGVINEYDIGDFRVKQTIVIPKDLYFWNKTKINKSGHVLCYNEETHSDRKAVVGELWYWDGEKEYRAEISGRLNCFPADGCIVRDRFSGPYLDAKETVFYWAIDRVTGFRQEPSGVGDYFIDYVTIQVELYRSYFQDDELVEELIAKIPFGECECATGACSETCPESRIVIPKEGIEDFIEIEHFVQGQLHSSIEGHTYLEKKGSKWIETSVNKKLEKPFVQIVDDKGCCGWINISSDSLSVIDAEKQKIIYDEWEQFDNRNYDISFYPRDAELSPDLEKIAYTIVPDEQAIADYERTGRFITTNRGKEDLDELERIKNLLNDLPMVEVKSIASETGEALVELKKAEFVGWIDNKRLLLSKDGKLSMFDISTQRLVESPISVKSIEQVFLR